MNTSMIGEYNYLVRRSIRRFLLRISVRLLKMARATTQTHVGRDNFTLLIEAAEEISR
jgi:hypothetical protein